MEILIDDKDIVGMLHSEGGKERGFRLLTGKYGKALYWHIRRIVVGHDDAEDAFQETCIKIFSNIQQLRDASMLKPWIYRIATNEAIKLLRRHVHLFHSIDDLGYKLADKLEEEKPVDAQRAEMVFQRALLTLPTQQRIAFNMRYYDEMPYEQIAKATGKNVSTLKTNYHLAAEKIKKYIKENA